MAKESDVKKRDDKPAKTDRADRDGKPAQKTERRAPDAELSDEDLRAIAGGPTSVERTAR